MRQRFAATREEGRRGRCYRNLKPPGRLNMSEMSEREIIELAAILVNEHGHTALDVAERRRDQHARNRHSAAYRLWSRIAAATARMLRLKQREDA